MSVRAAVRRAAFCVSLLILLIGFTDTASAAPIDLENDVNVSWSDAPCFFGPPQLCKPADELIQIVGAPRLVPDASNAGSLLNISVDFLGVSLDLFGGGLFPETPLILNIYDSFQNPVLLGGSPLQLTYLIPPSGGLSIPATDLFLHLGDFNDFGLLPPGEDLTFTVSFSPRLGVTDRSPDRPDKAVVITLSGVGTTQVPEPGTLLLLLSGVAITGLGTQSRRFGRRRRLV